MKTPKDLQPLIDDGVIDFDATMKDKEFLEDATRTKMDLNPTSGEDVQKLVERVLSTPKDILDFTRAAISTGGTFDCASIVKDQKLCLQKGKKAGE